MATGNNRRIVGGPVKKVLKERNFRDYEPGQIIVRVKPDSVVPQLGADLGLTRKAFSRLPENVSKPFDYLRTQYGLKDVYPLYTKTRPKRSTLKGLTAAEEHRHGLVSSILPGSTAHETLGGYTLLHVNDKKITPALLRRLEKSPAIELAERVPARWAFKVDKFDAELNQQWALRAIRWFRAKRPDARKVVVAVLDSGIDLAHPDLEQTSITYQHGSLKPQDLLGHGTHVVGILGAVASSDSGVNGVADCEMKVWKVFSDVPVDGEYYVDSNAYNAALAGALTSGARVLNLSLGGTVASQTERLVFKELQKMGILVVAAMGNEFIDGNPVEYPAAYENVLAVGAVDAAGRRARFSNTGDHIGLVAPGVSVLSTLPTNSSATRPETDYAAWDGTSMATPHVSGAAALLFASKPDLSEPEARKHLSKATRKLPAMGKEKWSKEFGSGLLDLTKVLS